MATLSQSTSFRVCGKLTDTHLADLHFKFENTESEDRHHGRLQVLINYEDPNHDPPHPRAHSITQSWDHDPGGTYQMRVTDFQIPVCLRSLGLGRFIWHQFYLGLPEEIRPKLVVSGQLSAVDAYTPVVDQNRRMVFKKVDGKPVPVLKNQIEGRNHFWERLVVACAPGRPVLTCDAEGNGEFRGNLKDLSHTQARQGFRWLQIMPLK